MILPNSKYLKLISIILINIFGVSLLFSNNFIQDDTLFVSRASDAPVLDGIGDDSCWSNASWQTIDQVWIPLNTKIDSTDFYGRFKITWSVENNLLYFLFETVDNTWVDGYVFGGPKGAHEYDCLEIFFDEDQSGGPHLWDYYDINGNPTNYNSENAFAYHIAIDGPSDEQTSSDVIVYDSDGTNWGDNIGLNFASHFDSFVVRRTGKKLTWEMSLIVYDSTYNTNPAAARDTLKEGKISGIAIAYCDDDTPTNIHRQSFIGSVPPNLSYLDNNGDFNDTWLNADHFGIMKLVEKEPEKPVVSGMNMHETFPKVTIFPNPVYNIINIEINRKIQQESKIKIFNTSGLMVKEYITSKDNIEISMDDLSEGLYFVSVMNDGIIFMDKILKVD